MDGKETLAALRGLLAMVDENATGEFDRAVTWRAFSMRMVLSQMFDEEQNPRAMSPSVCRSIAVHIACLLDVDPATAAAASLFQRWASRMVRDASTPAPAPPPSSLGKRRPMFHHQAIVLRVLGDLAWLWADAGEHTQAQTRSEDGRWSMDKRSAGVFRELPHTVRDDLLLAIINLLRGMRVPFDDAAHLMTSTLTKEAGAELLREIDQELGHEMRTSISWINEAPVGLRAQPPVFPSPVGACRTTEETHDQPGA